METKICLKCGKGHDGSFGSGKYCSRQCANSREVKEEVKISKIAYCKKCGEKVEVDKRANTKRILCRDCKNKRERFCSQCGALKGKCKRPDICKKHRIFPTLIKHFGFNKEAIGTERLYEEFERIHNILYEDYMTNELSTLELQEKYKCLNQRIINSLKSLDIERRSCSEAGRLAYEKEKVDRYKLINLNKSHGNPQYKSGYHTTWNNKQVFLRSSYEFDYAKQLDKEKVDYEVEKLRIMYWDSRLCKQRLAIPDFYLTQTNTIVEIKSNYTLDEQNMKDKFKAYKDHGYVCKLMLNKKKFDLLV